MSGPVKPYLGITPTIADDVFIADTAVVIGDVHIGAGSSVWYNTVIRGDAGSYIRIGERVNVQDGTVIHLNGERWDGTEHMPPIIGDEITIGHSALIHACTLHSRCFIGMRSAVLWRQLGGNRVRLLLARRKVVQCATELLEESSD